jgi:PAS domain S-box-containing protein
MSLPKGAVRSGIEVLLGAIAHPAIRLDGAERVTAFNDAAKQRFSSIGEGVPLEQIVPSDLAARVRIALASSEDEMVLDGFGARVLQLDASERLLLFDLPEVDAYHELTTGLMVWEYEEPELKDAGALRLVAANVASERLGPRVPTRSFLGRTRAEVGPIDLLSPLYLQVARMQQPAEVEVQDLEGRPFVIRVLPLPGRRIVSMFEDVSLLRKTQHGFRTMFDRSSEALLILDSEAEVVLAANPAAAQLFATSADDIIGKPLHTIVAVEPGLGARVARAGYLHFQTAREERRLDVGAMPIDHGPQKAVMAMITDVTEATETLEKLISDQEKFSALIENLPVVLWTVQAGQSVFISPRAERVTGYTSEQIQRSDFGDVWRRNVHPEDLENVSNAYAALFRDGTPFEAEYRFRRPDGVWRWITDHAVRTYEKAGRIYASGISADITERKRAERQQVALAEFGRRALRSSDDATLLSEACRTVAQVLEVPSTHVLRFDPVAEVFRHASGTGSMHPLDVVVPSDPRRLATQVLNSEAPLIYANLEAETRFISVELLSIGVRAGVAAPIAGRANRYGILHAQTTEPRAFTENEAAFVASMANILAEAMERNRAERELANRTAQLTDAQSVAHIDQETLKVEGSDELYRLFGIPPQSRELSTEWLLARLSPESRGQLRRVGKRLQVEDLVDEEHVIHADDGVERIGHYRASRRLDRHGRPVIIGTVQDVTAARQAEISLREHERRLQVTLSRLPVILFSTDRDLRLTSVAGEGFAPMSAAMLAGFTLGDLVGRDPTEIGPQRALEGGDATYDTKHGDYELRVHVEPLTDDRTGAVIGVVGLAFDVTEEKRAEDANTILVQRLEEAANHWRWTFDAIRAPLLILDAQNRVRRLNAAALRFSQFTNYRSAIDLPVTSLGESLMWTAVDALATTALTQSESVSVQFVDGDRTWDLLASSSGEQTVIIVSDVTDVVQMERNLRRAEKMSEMGALVAGVAHEVRNPLFGLSATLDAFESRFGSDEYQDYVTALREQIDRMSQLMHELLEYGRPVAALLQPFDIVPVVRRSRDLMDAFAKQRGVELRCNLPSMLPPVAMDRQRLLQVFENLLKNAVEHSPKGSEVVITARNSERPGMIVVEVTDRGPGFAAADLHRVFEPFFTKRRGGTGLGLSLVARIVEEHHGVTRASNRTGGGASMVVELPVAERA